MFQSSWPVYLLFFAISIFLGLMLSFFVHFAVPLVLLAGYLVKIKFSWSWQWLTAIGLMLGVSPLWVAVALLTSDTTTSIIFSLHIIGVPAAWLLGAWLQMRYGHRWWPRLKS
jgi:hypothetical protein